MTERVSGYIGLSLQNMNLGLWIGCLDRDIFNTNFFEAGEDFRDRFVIFTEENCDGCIVVARNGEGRCGQCNYR